MFYDEEFAQQLKTNYSSPISNRTNKNVCAAKRSAISARTRRCDSGFDASRDERAEEQIRGILGEKSQSIV
jgi:hypothetical protein